MKKTFHHTGVITDQQQPGEIYVAVSRVWVTSPETHPYRIEFLRFGTVGFIGFTIDNACVYGLRASIGLYWAGAAAYFVAASANWAINRFWTFRGRSTGGRSTGAVGRQWMLYLLVNLAGFTLNRGVYFLIIATSPVAVEHPVIATFAGTLAGRFANFHFSRSLVFR